MGAEAPVEDLAEVAPVGVAREALTAPVDPADPVFTAPVGTGAASMATEAVASAGL